MHTQISSIHETPIIKVLM